jgi:hypothetical protein
MKRLFTTLALCLMVYGAQAQVAKKEDLIGTWTVTRVKIEYPNSTPERAKEYAQEEAKLLARTGKCTILPDGTAQIETKSDKGRVEKLTAKYEIDLEKNLLVLFFAPDNRRVENFITMRDGQLAIGYHDVAANRDIINLIKKQVN